MADDTPIDFSKYEAIQPEVAAAVNPQPTQTSQPPQTPQIDFSKYETNQPSQPSDQSDQYGMPGFNRRLMEPLGLPGDITKWPKAIKDMFTQMKGPLPLTAGPVAPLINSAISMGKGLFQSSGAASQEGVNRISNKSAYTDPTAIAADKASGVVRYIVGGLPIAGPIIVHAMDDIESGHFAQLTGDAVSGILQSLMMNPEATAARMDAAGKYLFSKPRVREMALANETQDMLTSAEANARARVRAMAPKTADIPPVPGNQVVSIAEKALNDNIHGITAEPKPISQILSENTNKFKPFGAVEQPGGGPLVQLYTRLASGDPISMQDLHDYYSQLGDAAYGRGRIDGSVYNALKQTREGIGKIIDANYKSNPYSPDAIDPTTGQPKPGVIPRDSQWEDFKVAFTDMHKHWWDNDSPLYKSIHAQDPSAALSPFVGDSMERARKYLSNYTQDGADPRAVDAVNRLAKGMNQMQLRGLLQASGGLLASYLLRSEGAGVKIGTGAAAGLLTGRLLRGYLKTRPSLTDLLSEAAERPSLGKQLSAPNIPPGAFGDFSGNPTPFGPSGPSSPPSLPSQTPMEDIIHNSSTISPAEVKTIQSIGNSPAIPDNVKADIKAITDDLKATVSKPVKGIPDIDIANMGIMRLKGIMSIMRKQGVSYGEAIKQYDAKGKQ